MKMHEWSVGWARSSRHMTWEGILGEVGGLGTQGDHSEFKVMMWSLGEDV